MPKKGISTARQNFLKIESSICMFACCLSIFTEFSLSIFIQIIRIGGPEGSLEIS